tara:strand:- start:855 stop:1121 length:267 start_codon:yes stop_codon:yes gene_type:complete
MLKPFKKSHRVTLIENNKYAHLFKITFLDNSTAVFDNNFNYVMDWEDFKNAKDVEIVSISGFNLLDTPKHIIDGGVLDVPEIEVANAY